MLYLHIPFCIRKCRYCDFLSGPFTEEIKQQYLKALTGEILEKTGALRGRRVSSIFFGGGTPSVLEAEEIQGLMNACGKYLVILPDAEITMECNPGTVTAEKLKGYRSAGVNRLSIGLQSTENEVLQLLGRIHTWEAFLETYRLAREAGFENVNVDLMSALPGQTMENWKLTLEKVLSLVPQPEHISVYSLIMEEGTPFYDMNERGEFHGRLQLPSEEVDREMYHYTGERLRKSGLIQYEISNYAADGRECRHNCGYWIRRDYLGFGTGAASLFGNGRTSNERDLQKYLQNPMEGAEEELLSENDCMEEFMFLGLRMCQGVSRKEFKKLYHREMDEVYGEQIRKNCKDGLLEDNGERICLTERGMDLGNYVMAQFLL